MEKEISLHEAQMEVMEVIWDKGGRAMFGVLGEELAARGKSWKPNTILTLLSRLAENGMLTVRKQGRLNEYVSLVSREEYRQTQARLLVDRVFGGDTKHLISALVSHEYLPEDALYPVTVRNSTDFGAPWSHTDIRQPYGAQMAVLHLAGSRVQAAFAHTIPGRPYLSGCFKKRDVRWPSV